MVYCHQRRLQTGDSISSTANHIAFETEVIQVAVERGCTVQSGHKL